MLAGNMSIGIQKLGQLNLLGDVSLARGFVFLQGASALGDLCAYTTLAVKIAAIFSRATNSKFRYGQLLRANWTMLQFNYQGGLFIHLRSPTKQQEFLARLLLP